MHKFEGLSSRKSGHGRLDAVVNNIIIEYKHNTKLKSKKQISSAFEQVKDYLIALDKNEGVKYDAILTDGIKIAYFQFVGDVVCNTSLRNLTASDIDRIIKAILNNQSNQFHQTLNQHRKRLQRYYIKNCPMKLQRSQICFTQNGKS